MYDVAPILYNQWQDWRRRYVSGGNARETAYQIIRDKIISLDFKPGEALSDKQLAEQLKMSRTPVHEALIILATTNMVILKPQIGTFVAPIDVEWLEMEQFSRFATEKEIVALACTHITDEYASQYETNLQLYEQVVGQEGRPDRLRRLLELDNTFHRIAFMAAGREDNYFHMLDNMQHIERLRILSLLCVDQKETNSDHAEISKAIIEGNVVRAQYWLELHLHRYKDNLKIIQAKFPEYFL